MDISEEELMRIFNDADDDEFADLQESPTGTGTTETVKRKPMMVVQINFQVDYLEILRCTLSKLKFRLTPAGTNILAAELKSVAAFCDKAKMMRQYRYVVCMEKRLQSEEAGLSEHVAKQILKTAIPKLIEASIPATDCMNGSVPRLALQTGVIQYLSGNILRWALKKFTGEQNEWCRNQVDKSVKLHDTFESRDRGGLTRPCRTFTAMITKAERVICDHLASSELDYRVIIGKINPSTFFPSVDPILIGIILRRYIYLRIHIHCREKLRVAAIPKGQALRISLKRITEKK